MTSTQDNELGSYEDELKQYEQLIPYLIQVSDSSGGIITNTIGIESTKIYTRLVLGAMTIGSILPANQVNHSSLWDYSSVAILTRSLMEAAHRYFYLVEPGLSEEETNFRQQIYFYRINCEKYRLYSEKIEHEVLKGFEENLPVAKAAIMQSNVYAALDKNMAQKIRSGNSDMHLTDAEVAKRNGLITENFEFFYRLLSVQAHGSPMATTSQSNSRGRGLGNEAESFYLSLVLRLLSHYLSKTLLSQVELLSLHEKCSEPISFAREVQSRGEI
ncbi:DUF5677 domain-containing protein [Alcaligenes faecalis]|uniref:DUF5677 domain-containing protein n=1 Tax=Alcaligenes TaxID=507 RepID=UPI001C82D231|nr:DUF5677 domain-containing protein [Alcaligenes faecalis]MBX6963910.1 hypothetical protein [Providencia rettgeri]MBX7030560.1 hypothetical protein [Alcaligenes faecalis]